MSEIQFLIPPSVLRHLDDTPRDQPVVLLLRHSVRDYLPPGDAGYTLPITEVGRRLAAELGAMLRGRLRTLHASPLLRCVQTAEALRAGAEIDLSISPDRLLGDPGVFVLDDRAASSTWERLGHERVMECLVTDAPPEPGLARADEAARFLVHHMLTVAGDVPGVHVFVTHDSLVTATAARLLGLPLGVGDWPWYLEGAFFWRSSDGLHTAYREHRDCRNSGPLCGLVEGDVIELARREVAATVGPDCSARFFVAGGAYKTLLTGRPPRDLDIWAPSDADRRALLGALHARGARPLDERPFGSAFEIDGRVVEVPLKVEPQTLDARLGRFDIALSAVGVEHRPDGTWAASIHPLALESVRRKQILLLWPLVNWKQALSTLERMRRYAAELGFQIPAQEEDAIWSLYGNQIAAMRSEMMARFERTSRGGFGVAEDVARRFP